MNDCVRAVLPWHLSEALDVRRARRSERPPCVVFLDSLARIPLAGVRADRIGLSVDSHGRSPVGPSHGCQMEWVEYGGCKQQRACVLGRVIEPKLSVVQRFLTESTVASCSFFDTAAIGTSFQVLGTVGTFLGSCCFRISTQEKIEDDAQKSPDKDCESP